MARYARNERLALADLLAELGPEAPTLCEGWRTRDLAAHLVVRERRPDAAVGLVASPFARHLERVQQGFASRPYEELVSLVRTGPPRWSVLGLPGLDERANLAEFFVHHEDVRRAQPGWERRSLDPGLEGALAKILRSPFGRMLFRRSPVGVVLVPDGAPATPVRAGEPSVRLVGKPSELVLWAFGRQAVADVTIEGDDATVERLKAVRFAV
jgi:uncharacterized protein (TIGR03085 family)